MFRLKIILILHPCLTFLQVLEGGPVEGHRTQLSLRSAGGRLLHSLGAFAFEDKPRLGCSDLSILSEVCAFLLCQQPNPVFPYFYSHLQLLPNTL